MEKKDYYIFGTILILSLILCISLSIFSKKQITTEDGTLSKILKSQKIIVGTEGSYPPFNYYNEENELIGFDIDVIKEISKRMEIEIKLEAIPWIELFNKLKKNEVDLIIAAITITPERSQEMLFSDSYFKTGQVIIIKKSNTEINKPEDLSDKKVGTQVGTTSTEEALKYASNIKFITYDEAPHAIEDLKKDILDAAIIDFEVATEIVKNNDELKIIGDLLSEEYYGIAMDRENIELMQKINEILQEMQDDGTMDELKEKWSE